MRLGLRLGSAAVLLAILIGALAARGPVLDALAAMAVVVACWEYSGLMRRLGAAPLPWLVYPLAVFLLLRHDAPSGWPVLDWAVGGALVVGTLGLLVRPGEALDKGMLRWASAVGGALWLGLTLGYLVTLVNLGAQVVPAAAGAVIDLRWLVIVALGGAMVGDTAALFVGSAVGRHRFFPSISPRKSLEGAAGGLAGTVLTWSLAAPALAHIPVAHAVVLGVVCGVAAQGGDLVESALKRAARVKDSSELIPGHGGLLDRLDALLLLGPVLYAYVSVAVTRLP
ncbi:MAG TPA: phosphatidate cytidylyltransferase [Candidatus Dormibacteraeota bacterium]|jgi:CDP-diglyceride synthetase|nr:phosphatidate cytidylyltransferase [Candidatus Dormibacteraeota bacterium]